MIVEERDYLLVPGGTRRYLDAWYRLGRGPQVAHLGAPLGVYTVEVGDLTTLVYLWGFTPAQRYLDDMVAKRGYVLDYHKVMAANDFPVLRAADDLVDAAYLSQRRLDRRTKELLFVLSLTVLRADKAHIQSHIRVAIGLGRRPHRPWKRSKEGGGPQAETELDSRTSRSELDSRPPSDLSLEPDIPN